MMTSMLCVLLFPALILPITIGQTTLDFGTACSGCVYETSGVGYLNHPNDCNKYLICVRNTREVTVQACIRGLYWDNTELTCDWPINVECNHTSATTQNPTTTVDLCSARNATENKGIYLEFTGQSWREMECEEEQIFDSSTCQCVRDPCYGIRPSENNSHYQELIHGVWKLRPCARGSAFNTETCKCDLLKSTTNTGCRPVFSLTLISFSDGLKDDSGNNYIDNNGVYFNPFIAYWNGSSSLSVPFFANSFFGDRLSISFFFRRDDNQQRVLLSNSVCEDLEPSVLIYVTAESICFKLRNDSGVTVTVCLSYESVNVWTYVSLSVQDGQIIAMVPGQSTTKPFTGNIANTFCPLSIGKGTGYKNFKGKMTSLKVYAGCKPYVTLQLLKSAFANAVQQTPELTNLQTSTTTSPVS